MSTIEVISTCEAQFLVKGVIDIDSAPTLLPLGLKSFMAVSASVITVDLSCAEVKNSAGVALLLAWLSHMQSKGKSIHYVGFSEKLLRIIKVSNLSNLLGVQE